jgi:hypothetical protein
MREPDTWLVMALEPQLAIAVSAHEPGDELVLDSIRYQSSDEGAMTGFYDRILNDAGRFAGIRIWPVAERAEALIAALPERPYLRVSAREGCVDVYFDGPPYPNASSEGDQAFGGRFYRAAGGQIAISLDLGYLADSGDDLQAVRSARVRWANLAQ